MDPAVGLYTYSIPVVVIDKYVINFIKLSQAPFRFLLNYILTETE